MEPIPPRCPKAFQKGPQPLCIKAHVLGCWSYTEIWGPILAKAGFHFLKDPTVQEKKISEAFSLKWLKNGAGKAVPALVPLPHSIPELLPSAEPQLDHRPSTGSSESRAALAEIKYKPCI